MPLSSEELNGAKEILSFVQREIDRISDGDHSRIHSLRRYIWKRLEFAERGRPMGRRALKRLKHAEQDGLCAICRAELPLKDSELDRFVAAVGYTQANTRLVHHSSHRHDQEQKGYAVITKPVVFTHRNPTALPPVSAPRH